VKNRGTVEGFGEALRVKSVLQENGSETPVFLRFEIPV